MTMKKNKFAFVLDSAEGHKLKDGSYPIALVIRKDGRRKIIGTGLSAHLKEVKSKDGKIEILSQFNKSFQRYETDGRKSDLHPDRIINNQWLANMEARCEAVLFEFEKTKTDWTLNQFEMALLNKSKQTSVEDYFQEFINKLLQSGKIGNMNAYARTLEMLKLFDSRFGRLQFQDINLQYIRKFDDYLTRERGCASTTRKYYLKTLRSLMNKAIQDGEATKNTYPFGEGGYSIAALDRETDKRYLPTDYIEILKNAKIEGQAFQWVRNLFMFSYYTQGMAFVDMANLTRRNIIVLEGGKYIGYRRRKTEGKGTKPILIKISDKIQTLLDWFRDNTTLLGDNLLPIISRPYEGVRLYDHIRDRNRKFNKHLKALSKELGFEGVNLTSYVSRHSYAMRLKNSGVSEDVISQALGHKDLATTKVYLDSFESSVIDQANSLL